jgi:formylglycine-generating enzyme required for sulfatase activity
MKNDIQATKPSDKPSSKALFDQTDSPNPVRKWVTIGRSWFSRRTSGPNDIDVSRAETSTMLKKHYQRAKRRKRWLKRTGIIGVLFIVLGGIGTWLWRENRTFQVDILRAVSMIVSIHLPPDMISVPQGTFRQGEIPGENYSGEQPLRDIHIKKFAMGRFEVTFEEYDRFAISTGRPLPGEEGWGRERHPVINISWKDAVDYAAWLARETGYRSRLPTESEWEYASRNMGKGEIWAGTSEQEQLSTYAWFNTNSHGRTQPVGTQQPNGLGLHDLSGNVWEWVQDCWHDDYQHAPTNGAAWLEANDGMCGTRVRRGGGWTNAPMSLRSSFRNGYSADSRSIQIGFRLAQDIK